MLSKTKTKSERGGNARNDPVINITTLNSETKYHQFDPKLLFVGLRFESRDANHPVLERIRHALLLLECGASVHRELMTREMNHFRIDMLYLERRHRTNKVLERCSFPVDQSNC